MLSERRLPWINRVAAWQSRRFPILATYPQRRSMIGLRIRAPKGRYGISGHIFTSSRHGVKTNGPSFRFVTIPNFICENPLFSSAECKATERLATVAMYALEKASHPETARHTCLGVDFKIESEYSNNQNSNQSIMMAK